MNDALIPDRLLVDTGVLIRALEARHWATGDPRGIDCRDFWIAALSRKSRRVLVAAPSITEFLLKPSGEELPRERQVVYAAFDTRAARELAHYVPNAVVHSTAQGGFTKDCIRYDALIAACAKRNGATCVVSLDTKLMRAVCEQFQLDFKTPGDFRAPTPQPPSSKQGALFGAP